MQSRAQNLQDHQRYLPVGIYLGDISEGARIITFVRLYPVDHPDALGHEYPTASILHIDEVNLLIKMGKLLGWNLYATLHRFPDPPTREWIFEDFKPLPVDRLMDAEIQELKNKAPIPGLRALSCSKGDAITYIIDTRGLTLEARNMHRATSLGLEMPRKEFESELVDLCENYSRNSSTILLFK